MSSLRRRKMPTIYGRARRCDVVLLLRSVIAILLLAGAAQAQDAATSHEDDSSNPAKETQNPVADLISVPFQNNFNFNTGSENRTVWILNVQPVIPIRISEGWNLITRTIVPIINQPALFPGAENAFGLGDINPTFFL